MKPLRWGRQTATRRALLEVFEGEGTEAGQRRSA
jgi:hypothetical protein